MVSAQRPFIVLALLGLACATERAVTREEIEGEDLETCTGSVRQLLVQRAKQAQELRAGRPAEVYAEGQPLPQLERDLLPGLNLGLTQSDGKTPAFTISCRTWVCRVTVTARGEPGYSLRNTGNERRFDRWTSGDSRHDVDPATGDRLWVVTDWILLRDPAGAERTLDEIDDQARGSQTMPTDVQACRAVAHALYDEVAALRDKTRALPSQLEKRLTTSASNPTLAEEVAPAVLHALGLPARASTEVVDCRGNVCTLVLPMTMTTTRTLREDDRFWSRVENTVETISSGRAIGGVRSPTPLHRFLFEVWSGPARANGRRIVRRLMNDLVAALPKCQPLAPARGGVTVKVVLASATVTDPPPKLAVSYEGSALDTPYGRCLRELADRKFLTAIIPRPVSPHHESHDFLFPPEPASVAARP